MSDEELVAALTAALEAVAHWCQHEPCTTCQVISDEDFDAQIGAMAMHGGIPTWVEGKPVAFATALLPAFRDVLAAAARDAEKVRRVRATLDDIFAETIGSEGDYALGMSEAEYRIRRALDAP